MKVSDIQQLRTAKQSIVNDVSHLLASSWTEPDATTQGVVVWQDEVARLLHFSESSANKPVLLLCFALVNSPKILYLTEQHAFVKQLAQAGFDVFVLDWGSAKLAQQPKGIQAYVDSVLAPCVAHIYQSTKQRLHLAGICQGGILTSLFAAMHPDKVKSLIYFVTPGDCHLEEDKMRIIASNMKPIIKAFNYPYVEHVYATKFFLALKPVALQFTKYHRLLQAKDQDLFYAMEKWIFEGPPISAEFLLEYIEMCYEQNAFFHNKIFLKGQRIDLNAIHCPIINVIAERDHIVMPESSRTIAKMFPNNDYYPLSIDTGHIGLFVNHKTVPAMVKGLRQHVQQFEQ